MQLIKVDDLTRYYGNLRAVDRLSFSVKEGEILGFLGPNGAGKTTTLRMITGSLSPTSGHVVIGGHDVLREGHRTRSMLGYLPEKPPLYPEMTVKAYLDFVAALKKVPGAVRARRVTDTLEKTGLGPMSARVIATLSKGYCQRVGLAQALVHHPPVIVLDEPTVGLDPNQIIEVRELIRSLRGDHTVILSSHILQEVAATCQRVVIIHRGQLVAVDTPRELSRKRLGGERLILVVSGTELQELVADLRRLQGVVRVDSQQNQLEIHCDDAHAVGPYAARLAIQQGFDLHRMERHEISLEEVFRNLTMEITAEEEKA